MGLIELEIVRTVPAPIERVFARLADIEGHNEWMPRRGSILRRTRQTSPGEPTVGTTYVDDTAFGRTPGDIEVFEPPRELRYHWWNRSKGGRLNAEGWPGYVLEATGDGATLVRHRATLHTYGLYRAATPFLHRMAMRERTATMDALKASFEGAA